MHSLANLSPAERRALLLLLEEGDQKGVARRLDVSPETIKTHLRNAREKTGATSSFGLARALASEIGHTPERGMPPRGGATAAENDDIYFDTGMRSEGWGEELRVGEARVHLDLDRPAAPEDGWRRGQNDLSLPVRLFVIMGMAMVVAVLILLAMPLSESFQRFADVLSGTKR